MGGVKSREMNIENIEKYSSLYNEVKDKDYNGRVVYVNKQRKFVNSIVGNFLRNYENLQKAEKENNIDDIYKYLSGVMTTYEFVPEDIRSKVKQ